MPIHSSILAWRNPTTREAWWATVHGVAKNWTRLNDYTFTFTIKMLAISDFCAPWEGA